MKRVEGLVFEAVKMCMVELMFPQQDQHTEDCNEFVAQVSIEMQDEIETLTEYCFSQGELINFLWTTANDLVDKQVAPTLVSIQDSYAKLVAKASAEWDRAVERTNDYYRTTLECISKIAGHKYNDPSCDLGDSYDLFIDLARTTGILPRIKSEGQDECQLIRMGAEVVSTNITWEDICERESE